MTVISAQFESVLLRLFPSNIAKSFALGDEKFSGGLFELCKFDCTFWRQARSIPFSAFYNTYERCITAFRSTCRHVYYENTMDEKYEFNYGEHALAVKCKPTHQRQVCQGRIRPPTPTPSDELSTSEPGQGSRDVTSEDYESEGPDYSTTDDPGLVDPDRSTQKDSDTRSSTTTRTGDGGSSSTTRDPLDPVDTSSSTTRDPWNQEDPSSTRDPWIDPEDPSSSTTVSTTGKAPMAESWDADSGP